MKIALLGSIPKGDNVRANWTDWKESYMHTLQTIVPDATFVHGDDISDNQGAHAVVGHDLVQVKRADICVVDAQTKVGAGTAQEMVYAKYIKKLVVTVMPKDTHHRKTDVTFHGVLLDDWVHPFLYLSSDYVAVSIEDAANWIKQYFKNPSAYKIKDISVFDVAVDDYEAERPVENNTTSHDRLPQLVCQSERNCMLADNLQKLYEQYKGELLFHGWHHIYFVARKAVVFADELQVDKEIVEAAALTHDLNYVVDTTTTGPEAGEELRRKYLHEARFSDDEIGKINAIVIEEHTSNRHANISDSAKALADADSLFKVMPLNLLLFSSKFITETKVDLRAFATRIITEQMPLLDAGIYFYTETAKKKYLVWAKTDLALVQQVLDALEDPDIQTMLEISRKLNVI
jgi:uncharacterized protein